MQLQLSVVDPVHGGRADVLLDADPAVTAGALAAELARAIGRPGNGPQPPALYVDGCRIDPATGLGASPVRDGAVLSLHSPAGCPPPDPRGTVEVRVVGGPEAGGVHRLGPGVAVAGSGPAARIRLTDPRLPPAALELAVAPDGSVTVRPLPGAAAALDGEPLTAPRRWPPYGLVAAGRTLLELRDPVLPDAVLRPSQDGGGFDHNRPPRIVPPSRPARFALPPRPRPAEARPLPWAVAAVPLAGSVVTAAVTHRAAFLYLAALGPLTMAAHHLGERRYGRKSFRRALAEHRRQAESVERQADEAAAAETRRRRHATPDPAEVLLTATGPGQRLWERRRADADHGLLRIGTGTLRSAVEVSDPDREEHRRTLPRELADVPVAVPLAEHGVLGVAGPGGLPRALGRWLVAQAAVLHPPADLRICVLTDPGGRGGWEWVRWLPHARPRDGRSAVALIGTDAATVARRVGELLALLAARQEALREAGSADQGWPGPATLVVLDGSRRLRALPGVARILREGPAAGIRLVCLDSDRRLLPEECRAVAEEESSGLLRVSVTGRDPVAGVRPDGVTAAWCERVARALAPIRDGGDEDAVLPDSCRLLDLIGLEPPTAAAVRARWAAGGPGTAAVVGATVDGPLTVDLVRDGPHGLVAGTTGSGKSELLQTVVASLAATHRPDAVTFVLVDYKGGSAFKDCVQLPHTVGMVTDLDPHLVQRALRSLGAELRRRERLLADAGARDLAEYAAAPAAPGRAPLPRLLLVIDEFASLARELPDFVTGLVDLAQRGRSLGIHLVLATQRPSGVVSPEIRANTNLRIALRVTDATDSCDVVDAPDASRIAPATPGRAYARLGAASLLPFQAGRVGGRRPAPAGGRVPEPFAAAVGWAELGRPAPQRPAGRPDDDEPPTDLAALVAAVAGANTELDIPPQHSPWLPALPEAVTLDDLAPPHGPPREGLPPAPYAVEDLPDRQARRTVAVDLSSFGHLMVVGAPRSGRSQTLRTLAGALARTHSPADVHLYGLDCGNGALLALEALPHCGAVVRDGEPDRAVRLIGRLSAEVRRRMALLGEHGFTDIGEQRAATPAAGRLPHVVLFVDRWEGFTASLGELDSGGLTDALLQLVREGASAGVHVVLTGDRSLLLGRTASLTGDKLVLRLSDPSDLTLIGLDPRKVPPDPPPGRGFRARDGVETQVALLTEDPGGRAQSAALAAIGRRAAERRTDASPGRRPFRVDALPGRIAYEDAWKLRDEVRAAGPLWALAAVGGDRLLALGPDLAAGSPAFVVAGPPGSGRSTALLTMTRSLLSAGTQVVLAAPRARSPLRGLRGAPGVAGFFGGEDICPDELRAVLERLPGPAVILVDDAELLRRCAADDVLTSVVRRSAGRQVGLVAAGDADDLCGGFSGWQVEMRRARRGLLLSPQNLADADLIGVRLRRDAVGGPVRPGRGLLHLGDGEPRAVQVPLTSL